MSDNVKQALRVLLTEIVDYAGLFPPAELTMAQAIENYHEYLNHEHHWMLGRFIVPFSRLADFTNRAQRFWNQPNAKTWRISVLAKENLSGAAGQITDFNNQFAGKATIDCLETLATDAAQIRRAQNLLPANTAVYFEVPLQATLPDQMAALAIGKCRAKIRTGGVVQTAFPPVDELIKFVRIALAANVPFKATAGLHHPLRINKPLTYAADAPTGTMHGFFNLFLAAAFLRQNSRNNFVHQLFQDSDAKNFKFDDDGAEWRGNRVDVQQLKLTRERNAISFGSCSFVEPVEDLQQLGFLNS